MSGQSLVVFKVILRRIHSLEIANKEDTVYYDDLLAERDSTWNELSEGEMVLARQYAAKVWNYNNER